MSVESKDIVHAHACQLLQCKSAVQRLSGASLMLTALIQERKDNGDALRLAGSSGDETLYIGINVIRGHMILMSADRVFQTVIQHIGNNI